MLEYHNRGQQIPKLLITNVNGTIQSVMLPVLSKEQDNILKVKSMVRRSIKTSSFLIFPMMIGLALVAENLVLIVLTERWLMAEPFLQIFAISYTLMPIHTANLQAISALGKSDIFLRLDIIKKTIGVSIVLISVPFGIYALAIGAFVSSITSSFINAYPNAKLLRYSYFEQLKDLFPVILTTVSMVTFVVIVPLLGLNSYFELFMQVVVGF